jgi:ribosomal protein S18 acetylase RimI-like enzyme
MHRDIEQIRAFNRTITRRLGVLNEKYLGRDRPLAASRLLYEVGTRGAAVRELRARLDLDSGFVSRMLRGLERRQLITTASRPGEDGRVRFVRLTRAGMAELRRINHLSDELARSMLTPLSTEQGRRLVAAMAEVDRLLRFSSLVITPADPATPDAQRCLAEYFAELAVRFPGGYDSKADEAAVVGNFAPPKGCFLIARLYAEPLGCAALRTFAPGIGEIKRMWVAAEVRGLGVARRLLSELERIARRRGMRAVRLDTHASLTEAIRLYQTCGYQEIARFNDNPYAQRWFEKALH